MTGLGTFVNVVAIVLGSTIGFLLKHNLKEKYKDIMLNAIGIAILVVGISGALQYLLEISDTLFVLETILFLVIGSILGVFLKISERLDQFGDLMQKKFGKNGSKFSKGFVTATLIFCVGAMAINGAFQDGLNNDYTLLFSKSALDGITSMILASTLGIGVMLSAVPVFIYQLSLTYAASFLKPFLMEETVALMSVIGNILIIGISLNILEIRKIKVADMLPAVFLPIFYYMLLRLFT